MQGILAKRGTENPTARIPPVLLCQSSPKAVGEGTLVGTQGSSEQPEEPGTAGGRGQESRAPTGSHGTGRTGMGEKEGVWTGPALQVSRGETRTPRWPGERGGGPLQGMSTLRYAGDARTTLSG